MDRRFEALRCVLDRLLGVSVSAKGLVEQGSRKEAFALLQEAAKARTKARLALDRLLLLVGDDSSEDLEAVTADLEDLEAVTADLEGRLTRLGGLFSMKEARASLAKREAEALNEVGQKRRALETAMGAIAKAERSPVFQRFLLRTQLRLTPTHERESLSYGSTPFSSFKRLMTHPAVCRTKRVLVLGSSAGSLCFYAAALFHCKVTGVDILEPLVALAKRTARQNPDLGVDPTDFLCADIRDGLVVGPLLLAADLVVLTSTAWAPDLLDAVADLLAEYACPAVILDYSSHLNTDPRFNSLASVTIPVSWYPFDDDHDLPGDQQSRRGQPVYYRSLRRNDDDSRPEVD